MNDQPTREQIDACRPGSRDIESADFGGLAERLGRDASLRLEYEHVQQADAKLQAACQNVPAPPGLAERILLRLQTAEAEVQAASCAAPEPAADRSDVVVLASAAPVSSRRLSRPQLSRPQLSRRQLSRRQLSRRQWIGWSALAAGLLIAALGGLLWSRELPTRAKLLARAESWTEQLGSTWQPMASAPAGMPIPPAIAGSPAGWQSADKIVGRQATAFQLSRQGSRATLFVMKPNCDGLPHSPPGKPQSTTGDQAIAAWQQGGWQYVLVVEGDERNYRSFVNSANGQLASM